MSEQTFSQQVIQKANHTVSITDDLNRVITIRKPKFSHYLDLIKALGPELAKNSIYIENVAICCAVVSIKEFDDQKPAIPVTLRAPLDIDCLIRELEKSDDAFIKIAEAIKENFSEHKSIEEYKESIKK